MHKAKIDIAVLILFFNRPDTLEKVFNQVKLARPSKLYLFQDGAREGRKGDIENIEKCREIVADIDWECEVHQNYQEKNYGCDPSGYLSRKWMFAREDMGIILEDDTVPSQSFFPFCKELLEKYKDDQRINMICGMNNTGVSDHCPYDYLFSTSASIWGWATWKRVVDEWTDYIGFVDDAYAVKLFKDAYKGRRETSKYIETCKECNGSGIAYFESIQSSNALTQSRLNIIAQKNLISNIGFSGESTHNVSSFTQLPKGIRQIFNMKVYEYDFPLKHPTYVMEDMVFLRKLNRIMARGYPFIRFYRKCESIILRIIHGNFESIKKGFQRRIRRLLRH